MSLRAWHSPSGVLPGGLDPFKVIRGKVYGMGLHYSGLGTTRDRRTDWFVRVDDINRPDPYQAEETQKGTNPQARVGHEE